MNNYGQNTVLNMEMDEVSPPVDNTGKKLNNDANKSAQTLPIPREQSKIYWRTELLESWKEYIEDKTHLSEGINPSVFNNWIYNVRFSDFMEWMIEQENT